MHGQLNFEQLVKDGKCTIKRKNDDKITPINSIIVSSEEHSRMISIGQHNQIGKLNGIGRKIQVSAYGSCTIWEGEFKHDEL